MGESVDLVFADPPYGIGIDTWDKAIVDVPAFFALVTQHLKHGGFFAFTHQMPYMVAWLAALESTPLRYKDHIAWVKRVVTSPALPLIRSHENLFIYEFVKSSYYKTKGNYSDVKVSGLLFDLVSMRAIQEHIKGLEAKIDGSPIMITSNGIQRSNSYNFKPKAIPQELHQKEVNFTNVWSFMPDVRTREANRSNIHVTPKPILLMNRLLELATPEHATIYDAFLGSGTTLISGETTNRTVYGMELSEAYCSAIIARWQGLTGRKAVQV